ncbi:NAD(P)-binding protein [Sphingomonas sp. MMSM20]|uniref:NAD(P)-binding protein n=1 Tax=Sphingomonas lycopersici TaxID=2951807 RepID=UPI002238DD92|nr:NAD(P)-binding protein [Sphingomonas lycopersici]MCW6528719.1 NAD(P)-binding protein [Sphingomonas lycopersici]
MAIERRDFLNGAAIAITGISVAARAAAQGADGAPANPPALEGLRGSAPGSFTVAHGVRDGKVYDLDSVPVAEAYDLIIVGGGISGLSAAYFHRQLFPQDTILILDNHDDFGGHARRNEFDVDGKTILGYGGTQSIDSPRTRYSAVASNLLRDLGIEIDKFATAYDQGFYDRYGLGSATFFKKEVYGVDRLVPGIRRRGGTVGDPDAQAPPDAQSDAATRAMIDQFPMSDRAKALIAELETSTRDPLAGKTVKEKRAILDHISYEQYIRQYWGATDEVVAYYQQRLEGLWAVGIDALSASQSFGSVPGSRGLKLGREHDEEPYIYHFPDGNASIARMLVRRLVPGSAPGNTMEDILFARFDYAALDRAGAPVRLRLQSTAVKVRNAGAHTEVGYVRDGKLVRARARNTVLACYNMMIPYILDGVPAAQAAALRMNVKAPLVYVNVAQRNWRAWAKLGIDTIRNPAGMFSSMMLDFPVSLGNYHFARTPDDPIVAHLMFVPISPGKGLDMRAQFRAGHARIYAMSFGDFERGIRDEMTRILGPGGFDFDRDVAGITVNRWPHGYAYTADPLWDDPAVQAERVRVARLPVGLVTIANSDAGWDAYTNVAIDEAHRAIGEIAAMRGGVAATKAG